MNIIRNDKFIKRNKTNRANLYLWQFNHSYFRSGFRFWTRCIPDFMVLCRINHRFYPLTNWHVFHQPFLAVIPRFDEIFATAFEKLRHDYTFYVYSSPVPMLLVGPCNLWVPIPLTATGKISYINGKWKQEGGNFMMKVFGQEGLGKPDQDALANEEAIRKYLLSKGIPEEEQPNIQHVLVIMMKTPKIGEVSEAPIPLVELQN